MWYGSFYGWRPYVSVAERRHNAAREMEKLKKKGHPVSPVAIDGRTIAHTFWGESWCTNLESYSDFSNRLPRGRTYVRNGSVVDLQIAPGEVNAYVSGSELYRVKVKIASVARARWTAICADCAGEIDSLIELLQGRFSRGVMDRLCCQTSGLFPRPSEISFSCSCPDEASMCKHVAAVLYGVGARLDEKPAMLFLLRKVDEKELVARAGTGLPLARKGPAKEKVLAAEDLSAVFGIELDDGAAARTRRAARTQPSRTAARGAVRTARARAASRKATKTKRPRRVRRAR